MSLTEIKVIDKIEIVENGNIQVREVTRIVRDNETIAQNFHRFIIAPGEATQDMDPKVIAICNAVHTPEVIAAYQTEQARLVAEMQARQAANAPHVI